LKDDLELVRDWAEGRIKAGDVPDWSWHHHVDLIETIDAVLYDLSMAREAPRFMRRTLPRLRLAERRRDQHADLHVTPLPLTQRRARIPH
jgi:hypothetical protein